MHQPLIDHAYDTAEKAAEMVCGKACGNARKWRGNAEMPTQVIDFTGGNGLRKCARKCIDDLRKCPRKSLISLGAEMASSLYYVWWRRPRSASARSACHLTIEYRLNFSQSLFGNVGAILQLFLLGELR